jgi:hypothetical protein
VGWLRKAAGKSMLPVNRMRREVDARWKGCLCVELLDLTKAVECASTREAWDQSERRRSTSILS